LDQRKTAKMDIREAKQEDLSVIMEIIAQARSIMRENGNLTQWSDGYPSSAVISNDIASGHAFVCVETEQIVGYFCLMQGKDPDPNYHVIENGKWLNENPYGVIHRLASGRMVKGIAQTAFDFSFSKISNIRVDTHHDNLPMQNFLQKNAFMYCGIIYVTDGTPRDAFQKQLMQPT
jgi:ribosomal protein S18 acetylase RimI-like enzyme